MELVKVLVTDDDLNIRGLWTCLKYVGTPDINHDRMA